MEKKWASKTIRKEKLYKLHAKNGKICRQFMKKIVSKESQMSSLE
jgi:hypothetical protein